MINLLYLQKKQYSKLVDIMKIANESICFECRCKNRKILPQSPAPVIN